MRGSSRAASRATAPQSSDLTARLRHPMRDLYHGPRSSATQPHAVLPADKPPACLQPVLAVPEPVV